VVKLQRLGRDVGLKRVLGIGQGGKFVSHGVTPVISLDVAFLWSIN
jgi:hypothetical protein